MNTIAKRLKFVAVVVVSGAVLAGAAIKVFRGTQSGELVVDAQEAFKAGILYGERAADMARAKGLEAVHFEDSSIDNLRVTLTASRYQDMRLPFIDGFRQGYETARTRR